MNPHITVVGDGVRSYDFPDLPDMKTACFVEGIVEAFFAGGPVAAGGRGATATLFALGVSEAKLACLAFRKKAEPVRKNVYFPRKTFTFRHFARKTFTGGSSNW